MLEKYPIVDIRGRGLMSAIEFGGEDGSLKADYGTAGKVVKACGDRGLLILSAGMAPRNPLMAAGHQGLSSYLGHQGFSGCWASLV